MQEERTPDRNLAIGVAVSVFLALLSALILPNPAVDAVVTAAIAEEVHARACIAQYGPGERPARAKKPVCALGTYDVPATALSYPLAKQ
jgi:hypothetical protein